GGIYSQLVELFQRADVKYNSGLFHFSAEKGQITPADTFTPGLKIDDKALKGIINSIYYPCPYIFKEIPVEILGQVYEQFLGKVIRLTAGRQAKVEEKPEVRKAGGVYYTPKYIVDYIVQNTVGKLLEGKTPQEAAKLKIVDPACGSGSFLLGAYQHLLDWHVKWYMENEPEKWARGKNPALMQTMGGGWKLTTAKKKEILVNNIHGVDIDAQAVEVTKLSLLLKVLEEESGQLSLGFERVLPDLGKNIQCGNSLIGEDYFAGRLVVDEEERRRVNPFEWQSAFPQVFKSQSRDLYLVTCVTHNSRISERMVEYGVKTGDPVIINAGERYLIAEKIAECIHSHQIPAVVWNVLPDHVHMVLAADSVKTLDESVRKIKGFSS
ncbi:MAG: DNA methyltransferase, partial [Anaerolineaceae bacterium]|nr:DNA methyltransferase [Anaerolineaceae bacterium]